MLNRLLRSPLLLVGLFAWVAVAAVLLVQVFGGGASGDAGQVGSGLRQGAPLVQPFRLVDQAGRVTTEQDMLGRPTVIFFGFTTCPEVCPTTLADLSAMLGTLGSDADRLNVFFVTVDPERDTVAQLKAYVGSFDPRIRALTGEADQLAAIARALGIYAKRVDSGDGSYTFDHTASVMLLDAEGRFVATIAYGEARDAALAKLKRLLRGPGG